MKKTFISGLAVVIPFAITIWVFVGVFGAIDNYINMYINQWFGFNFIGLGVLLALAVTFISGIITRTRVGNLFYSLINKIIFKMPLISKIYKLAKETIDVVTTKQAFKTVVRVEFPRDGVYSIGFLTNDNLVFIPTVPNPTSGFLIETNKYEVLDMTVEEAVRRIVSMGTIKGDKNGIF
jgi:uncharacterized membrane protein